MPLSPYDPNESTHRLATKLEVWDPAEAVHRVALQAWVWDPAEAEWRPFLQSDVTQAFGDSLAPSKTTATADVESVTRNKTATLSDDEDLTKEDRENDQPFGESLAPSKTTGAVDDEFPKITAAVQDVGALPTVEFDLTFSLGGDTTTAMTLQRNDSNGGADNWVTVSSSITAGTTAYTSAANSTTRGFRLKFNGGDYTDEFEVVPVE